MPVNVKVINAKEFIRTSVSGALDFAESKLCILDIAAQIKQPGEYKVLMDIREAETILSIANLYELAVALAGQASLTGSKIGILGPMSGVYKARFFETVARYRGARIRAFTDFDEAITWLALREPDDSTLSRRRARG